MCTETIRLIREGEGGERGKLYIYMYLLLHCHHQNDSCIKMGSDESHFNVSLIVRDKVTRRPQTTTVCRERGAEVDLNQGPSAYQPNPFCIEVLCVFIPPFPPTLVCWNHLSAHRGFTFKKCLCRPFQCLTGQ